MTEDEMNRLIRDTARESYHPPPEPPRDEMWARIRAARPGSASADGAAAYRPGDVVPTVPGESAAAVPPRHGRAWRWGWRALPIAALLLLSFGLGRLSLLYQGRPAAPVATTTPPATTSPGQLPAVADVSPPAVTAPIAGASAPGGAALATAVPAAGEGSNAGVRSRNGVAGNGAIYRFAAAQTLGQAELLLTSFRAETRARGSVDPQVAEWAGDVLSSTRLLLDSPAGRDPKLRGLLEDVELVLAQIVQLRAAPAAAAPGDADLIDHALQQRDLLPRLRSAVPAGAPVGT